MAHPITRRLCCFFWVAGGFQLWPQTTGVGEGGGEFVSGPGRSGGPNPEVEEVREVMQEDADLMLARWAESKTFK